MIFLFLFLFSHLIYSKPLVVAYFAIFDEAYNSTMNVSHRIPWGMFDRIIISFAILGEYGNMTNERATDDARIRHISSLYRKARPNGEIFMSIYGEVNEPYLYAAKHPKEFLESVLAYLKRYNLDGLDLDWETQFINSYSEELTTLLKVCYQVFKGRYKLSHAIWPGVHDPQTVGLLAEMVDQINIMSYYMSVNNVEELIKQYNQSGFPYNKMIVGMETESQLESQEIIAGKMALIKKYQLGGLFEWRLDNDDIPVKDGLNAGSPTFKTTKMIYDALYQN